MRRRSLAQADTLMCTQPLVPTSLRCEADCKSVCPGFKPTRFDLVAGSPTLEESNLSKKGDDPRTDQVSQGADSNLPGWQPKEKDRGLTHNSRAGNPKSLTATRVQEVLSNQRGYCTKGRGPKDPSARIGRAPRTLASRRHWLLQVVAATAGVMDGLDLSIFHVGWEGTREPRRHRRHVDFCGNRMVSGGTCWCCPCCSVSLRRLRRWAYSGEPLSNPL